MYLVLLVNTTLVFLLLTLISLSGVRLLFSSIVLTNKVAVFCFLGSWYQTLFGTAIVVCVDCWISELASTLSLEILLPGVHGPSLAVKLNIELSMPLKLGLK